MRDDSGLGRNGRLYLSGLAASILGNSALSLVAGIWVKALTGSSAQAGLVSVCVYAPSLAGPLAGLLVDRVDRRRWLIAVNLVSAAVVLSLLAVSGAGQVWLIFVVMAFYGAGLVLIDPAESALFAQLFNDAVRRQMNGWRLSIQESGRLVAPLVGAGLFTALGGGAVAALDAASFVVAGAATAALRMPVAGAPQGAPGRGGAEGPTAAPGLWLQLAAGVRHIWADVPLRRVAIATAGVMAISGIGVAAQYSLVAGLGQRPAFLGVLTALLGAGSVVASLLSARLLTRIGDRRLVAAGIANFALGNVLRATGWLPAVLAGSLLLGFALPWAFLGALNLAQRCTPEHLQGRVSAALTLALFGPQAPVQALGSAAIADFSYNAIFLGSAALSLPLAVWLAGSRAAGK